MTFLEKQIIFRVDKETFELLDRESKIACLDMSTYIRVIILKHLRWLENVGNQRKRESNITIDE